MNIRHTFAAVLAVGLATTAQASPIDLVSVTGTWENVEGGMNVNFPANEVRWGTDIGDGQSGYRFDPAAPPEQTGIDPEQIFTLGTFTHFNFPIASGTSITGVDLLVSFVLRIPSGDLVT
jgi:hypothetical protein